MLEKYFSSGECSHANESSYTKIHAGTLEKVASERYTPAELLKKAEELKPREDGRYVLINAMGAGEYWGANRNGDYFPEWSLRGDGPPEGLLKKLAAEGKSLQDIGVRPKGEYGLETFVKHAFVYRNHVNKDPQRSIGSVEAAAYNDKMHRVELILFIRKADAPDVVDRIDTGQPVAFSMGGRLLKDVCSICGNSASRRSDYCGHLSQQMKEVFPNGQKVFSLNYYPQFFDISEVVKPADIGAYMLKKVASELTIEPTPSVDKEATIVKRIPTQDTEDKGAKPYPEKSINAVRNFIRKRPRIKVAHLSDSPVTTLNSLTAAGIILKQAECEELFPDGNLPTTFTEKSVDSSVLNKLAKILPKTSLFIERTYEPTTDVPLTAHNTTLKKYATYLQSLNSTDVERCLALSAGARFSADETSVLVKAAGVSGGVAPAWLPFVFGILSTKE